MVARLFGQQRERTCRGHGHTKLVYYNTLANNPFSNIRVLEDQRIYISDMDGNSFVIPDPTALDRASYVSREGRAWWEILQGAERPVDAGEA